MSEKKVTLGSLVGQAWQQLQGTILDEVKKKVEEWAEAERESRWGCAWHRRGGNALRRWGYKLRELRRTPWGRISGLRLPRLRDVEKNEEGAFLSSEGAESRLAERRLASTLGGMSYRKAVRGARAEPEFVQRFWQGFDAAITFLKLGLGTWTCRLKTMNVAEGGFRHLRRFPGFISPDHAQRALGLYLLRAEYA